MQRPRDDQDVRPTKIARPNFPIFLRDMIKNCSSEDLELNIHRCVQNMPRMPKLDGPKCRFLQITTALLVNSFKHHIDINNNYEVITLPEIACENMNGTSIVLPTVVLDLHESVSQCVDHMLKNSATCTRTVFNVRLNYTDTSIGHVNACIFDHQKKTFTHFEPCGVTSFKGRDPVRVVFKNIIAELMPDYAFIDQIIFCPDGVQGEEFYCVFWSALFAFMRVGLDLTDQQVASALTSRGNGDRLLIVENFMWWLWQYVEYTGVIKVYYVYETAFKLAVAYGEPTIIFSPPLFNILIKLLNEAPEKLINSMRHFDGYPERVENLRKIVKQAATLKRQEYDAARASRRSVHT